jgi:YgiT-type zinc finger domain-containing protein
MQDVDIYECFGVKEPFEIYDVNKECSEYPERRSEVIGCSVCGADYKNEIKCYSVKLHRGDSVLINDIPIQFCPNCGRKL